MDVMKRYKLAALAPSRLSAAALSQLRPPPAAASPSRPPAAAPSTPSVAALLWHGRARSVTKNREGLRPHPRSAAALDELCSCVGGARKSPP